MKKLISVILISCLHLLCSCDIDLYKGKRPVDYPHTSWACEEYNISFSVEEKHQIVNPKMVIDGKEIPFSFLWSSLDNRVNIQFELDGQEYSLSGRCKFGKNKFSITIEDTESVYPEKKIVMTLVKQ